jgi:hypothetical protein
LSGEESSRSWRARLGESLLAQGKSDEADRRFLEVLSYEWATILGHPQGMGVLRDRYIEGIRGLISCRRGNLKALQDIYFVPSVDPDVRPELNRAIEEAKHPD